MLFNLIFCLRLFCVEESHVSLRYCICMIKISVLELEQILKRKLDLEFVKLLVLAGFLAV